MIVNLEEYKCRNLKGDKKMSMEMCKTKVTCKLIESTPTLNEEDSKAIIKQALVEPKPEVIEKYRKSLALLKKIQK